MTSVTERCPMGSENSDFDHHTEEFAQRWEEQYAAMRSSCPVTHSSNHGGFYAIAGYDNIKRVLHDPATFVCGRDIEIGDEVVPGGVTVPTNPFQMGFMEMDPPEATAHRRILAAYFSSKAIDAFRPRMRELVDERIDAFIETGELDFVDDLANPIPAIVSLDIIGLPLDKSDWYATVMHKAVYREPGSAREVAAVLDDVKATVVARRAEPDLGDDVIGSMLKAEVDGEPLSDDRVVNLIFMLLSGGIDTSTALFANVFWHLHQHPDLRQRLIEDPDLIPDAVTEYIRFFTPGTGVARTVREPVEVAGVELQPGARVLLGLGSANRDGDAFDDPDRVDFERPGSSKHLAFGSGIHRCLGSFLAQAEMEIVLRSVLERLPDYDIDDAAVVAYPTIPMINGFMAMPARFTPGTADTSAGEIRV